LLIILVNAGRPVLGRVVGVSREQLNKQGPIVVLLKGPAVAIEI